MLLSFSCKYCIQLRRPLPRPSQEVARQLCGRGAKPLAEEVPTLSSTLLRISQVGRGTTIERFTARYLLVVLLVMEVQIHSWLACWLHMPPGTLLLQQHKPLTGKLLKSLIGWLRNG